jgi:hypothetical protein
VQGFFLFCHLIFLPKICCGPILVQFRHTPLQITLFAEQRISSSQQLQRKMATDAFIFFLPGDGGEAGLLLLPSAESSAKFPGPRL